MILDSSAIIAILRTEPEATAMAEAIAKEQICRVSAVSYVEAAIVIDGARDPIASRRFDDFMRAGNVRVEAITAEHARIARDAYRDFGKGRHRARLNFGDCFSYALAKVTGEPLLFKGDDFCYTDVEPAN